MAITFTKKIALSLVAVAAVCLAPLAQADSLLPNNQHTFAAFTPNTAADKPTGAAIASTTGTFNNSHFDGFFTESVYKSVGGTNLDYVFTFDVTNVNAGNSPDAIFLQGFGVPGTLDFFTMGSGATPYWVSDNNGTVELFFNGGVPRLSAGTTTEQLVFSTNSPWGPATNLGTIQNGQVSSFQDLAPAPEPSSMLLLGSGLSGLAMMLRRRKKA